MPTRARSKGKQFDTRGAAEYTGIRPGSIQRLRYRDRTEPRTYPAGHEKAGQPWYRFPPPDGYIGNQPWWYEATLAAHVDEVRPPGRPAAPKEDTLS